MISVVNTTKNNTEKCKTVIIAALAFKINQIERAPPSLPSSMSGNSVHGTGLYSFSLDNNESSTVSVVAELPQLYVNPQLAPGDETSCCCFGGFGASSRSRGGTKKTKKKVRHSKRKSKNVRRKNKSRRQKLY